MRNLKYKALAAAVLLLWSIFLTGCGARNEVKKEVPAVSVMALKKSSLTVTVDYPSRLLPRDDIDVSAKIPGRVAEVNFKVGSEVKKGDILFTLEAEDSKSQLRQTEAALSGTKENIKQQLLNAETALDQAQLRYDDVKSNYGKIKALYKQGAASRQQMDDIETSFKNAGVSLEAAKRNLEILKGSGSGGLAAAQANQAQSAVDAAAVLVENSVIRSPIDGKVSACNVKAGELTSSAVAAYTIIDSSQLTAEIGVPAEVQAVLEAGQTITVEAGISDRPVLYGKIDTISPAADARTGFYTVKLLLDNRDGAVTPGIFAKAVIPVITKENVFTVPGGAIISENGIEYLFVVQDGTVVKKIVTTGASNDTVTEIQGDLKEGDRIILEGQSFLNEGEKVEAAEKGS